MKKQVMEQYEENERRSSYWLPRVVGVIFAIFIVILAVTALFEKTVTAMSIVMHLVPPILICVVLAVGWKRERIGGILFIILGVAFTLYFQTYSRLDFFLSLSSPLFLIGLLFLLEDIRGR